MSDLHARVECAPSPAHVDLDGDLVAQYCARYFQTSSKSAYNNARTINEFLEVVHPAHVAREQAWRQAYREAQEVGDEARLEALEASHARGRKRGELQAEQRLREAKETGNRALEYELEEVQGVQLIPRAHPLDVTWREVDEYVAWLKSRPLALAGARKYLSTVKGFFEFVYYHAVRQEVAFAHPVSTLREYDKELKQAKFRRKFPLTKFIPRPRLRELLARARRIRPDLHVQVLLLAHASPRKYELLTTKLADLHVDEGYFVTGFEDKARKTTGKQDELVGLTFFFPDHVKLPLKQYMMWVRDNFPGTEWLFPSHQKRKGVPRGARHTSSNSLDTFLRDVRGE